MRALALLIGNSNYQDTTPLINSANDATALGEKLHSLGFVTTTLTNVTMAEIDQAVDNFGNELNNYDVGLFYFAGHGFQVTGENFLTAIDTPFDNEYQAKYRSLNLDYLISYMERASNNTNIIILDACRNNPFSNSRTRDSRGRTLAPVYAPKGSIIAFSTSPGQTALDGTAQDGNGVYTRALLQHIDDARISIEEFFKRVRNSVFAFSNERQTSWEHTSLTGPFIFNSGTYIHASQGLYSAGVLADKNYLPSTDILDSIILNLKSHNWYAQESGMGKIAQLTGGEHRDKLFLLGRNILQTACGGEFSAKRFMERLASNLQKFNSADGNHVLNGMLFEIYFDSDGKLRDSFKSCFLTEIFGLSNNTSFHQSFSYIENQLQPFGRQLLFIPSSQDSISIDILLSEREIKFPFSENGYTEYIVESIKYNGSDVYHANQTEQLHHGYISITYDRLKQQIANKLAIPIEKLSVQTNKTIENDTPMSVPWDFKLQFH